MQEPHLLSIRLPVGQYTIGGVLHLGLPKRPKWLHRQCMRIFFGIVWTDGVHPDALQALVASQVQQAVRPPGVPLQ